MFFLSLMAATSCTAEMDRAIVTAAGTGDVEEVKALLARGADIEARAVDDWTPLTAAARGGHVEIIRVLLAAGAQVNGAEGGGNTALFWAAFHGHLQAVELLLANGAHLDSNHESNEYLFRELKRAGYAEIEDLLRSRQKVDYPKQQNSRE